MTRPGGRIVMGNALAVALLACSAMPVLAHAQEATLSGTVTDTTGGALPGVTVRAVHEASGNKPVGFLAAEARMVKGAKKIALMCLGLAAQKHGEKLTDEQEVLGLGGQGVHARSHVRLNHT